MHKLQKLQCDKADYARYENFKTGGVTKQQLDQAKLALMPQLT
jgi:hypothetical protein